MEKSFWRGSGWGRMVAQINGGDGRACERAVGQAGKRAGGNGQARGRSSECGHTRMRGGARAAGERSGRESGARERADSGDNGIRGRLRTGSAAADRVRGLCCRVRRKRAAATPSAETRAASQLSDERGEADWRPHRRTCVGCGGANKSAYTKRPSAWKARRRAAERLDERSSHFRDRVRRANGLEGLAR